SSRRRHTRWPRDWSSDVCSSDLFYGVFKAMHGNPVTIRTIDPPLHEFLPKREELMVDVARLEALKKTGKELDEKKRLLARVEQQIGRASCRERGWAVVGVGVAGG